MAVHCGNWHPDKMISPLYSALSSERIQNFQAENLPIHPMHWLPLCPPWRSSTPQRSPPSLCSCELEPPSEETKKKIRIGCSRAGSSDFFPPWISRHRPGCSRCGHTCQRSRWRGACRRDWRPRCRPAPGGGWGCECTRPAPRPTNAPLSQRTRCGNETKKVRTVASANQLFKITQWCLIEMYNLEMICKYADNWPNIWAPISLIVCSIT